MTQYCTCMSCAASAATSSPKRSLHLMPAAAWVKKIRGKAGSCNFLTDGCKFSTELLQTATEYKRQQIIAA